MAEDKLEEILDEGVAQNKQRREELALMEEIIDQRTRIDELARKLEKKEASIDALMETIANLTRGMHGLTQALGKLFEQREEEGW